MGYLAIQKKKLKTKPKSKRKTAHHNKSLFKIEIYIGLNKYLLLLQHLDECTWVHNRAWWLKMVKYCYCVNFCEIKQFNFFLMNLLNLYYIFQYFWLTKLFVVVEFNSSASIIIIITMFEQIVDDCYS